MGFENLAQNAATAAEEASNGSSQTEGTSTDTPQEASSYAPKDESTNDVETQALTTQEIIDLDKLEKFRMHGEEWTRDKLASSMLRQADYTRKTQEFSKERKFYDNLAYDIANVMKNPSLVSQFKKIYPEKFHQYLEPYSQYLQTKRSGEEGQPKEAQVDHQLLSRIDQIENRFRSQEVQAAEAMLDSLFKGLSDKYPFADEASVISKSLALMEQRKRNGEAEDLSKSDWDRVFKGENDRVQKLSEARWKSQQQNQLKANRKARDVAPGGDAVGQSPKKLTMKEATEAAIRDLTGR